MSTMPARSRQAVRPPGARSSALPGRAACRCVSVLAYRDDDGDWACAACGHLVGRHPKRVTPGHTTAVECG